MRRRGQRLNQTEVVDAPRSGSLDERMLGMDGLEAARVIVTEEPEQPIVLFTAYLNDELAAEAASIGVCACLSKDDIRGLPQTVMTCLGAA